MGSSGFGTQWFTVYASVAAPGEGGFMPVTAWIPANSITAARMVLELRNRVGNLEVIGAVQFANDPTTPIGSPVKLGTTWADTEGVDFPASYEDLAGLAAGKQLVRFGLLCRNSSGTSLSLATVAAQIEYHLP